MRDEKRSERRAHIIRSAREVFLRYGYRKTALEDVARAASLGKATLYHYFDGKDALFGAVVAEMYDEYLAHQRATIAQASSAADQLRRYAGQLIAEHRKLVGTVREFGRLDLEFPDRVHAHLRRQRQGELMLLEGVLQDGVASGEFRGMNTTRVALLLLGSLRAMIMDTMNHSEDGDGVVTEFLEILFCGLLANSDGKELT
ncbi:MAG: TetR/AcrR family transcriptional regulator [Pseudomonadota bacterium]